MHGEGANGADFRARCPRKAARSAGPPPAAPRPGARNRSRVESTIC